MFSVTLTDLCVVSMDMDDGETAGTQGERALEADITRLQSQITPFSHRISHSFPNELNGLRAESHLFKPDEVGQKIDLPEGLICAHATLDRRYVHFFLSLSQPLYRLRTRGVCGVVTVKAVIMISQNDLERC